MSSYGPPHMAEQKWDNQLEHTYSSYVRLWDVVLQTCQRRWMIGRSGERGSRISVLAAWHDDDFFFGMSYLSYLFLYCMPCLSCFQDIMLLSWHALFSMSFFSSLSFSTCLACLFLDMPCLSLSRHALLVSFSTCLACLFLDMPCLSLSRHALLVSFASCLACLFRVMPCLSLSRHALLVSFASCLACLFLVMPCLSLS